MGAGKTIIISRNWEESEIIKNLPQVTEHAILALMPSAAAPLLDNQQIRVLGTTDVYSDVSHVKSIINLLKVQDEFVVHAKAVGSLSDVQINAVKNLLVYISGAASFFYIVLKKYDEFFVLDGQRLKKISGWEKAFDLVVSDVLAKSYGGKKHHFSWLHKQVMESYNRYVVKKLGKHKIQLIADGARPSSRAFAKAAVAHNKNLAVLLGQNPMKNMAKTFKQIRRSLRAIKKKDFIGKNIPLYFFYPAKSRSYADDLRKIIELCSDRFVKLTLQVAFKHLEENLRVTAGFEVANRKHINALRPDIITTDGIFSGFDITACKYAKESGGKIVLFNHASHSAQTGISAVIGNLWASGGIIFSPYATHLALRSPALATLINEISDEGGKIHAVRHNGRLEAAGGPKKFNILFAGNYLGVQNHVPWVLETPDEFIRGIAELADAVGQIPEAELVIRVKAKKEFTKEIIARFVKDYPNVVISNEGSMKDALTKADLMVASISTTVDEALASGRPVLLHSWPKRYQHLPHSDGAARGAVYASSKQKPLVELLRQIVALHAGKPLADAELEAYIWPASADDMAGFAKRILET